MSIMSFISGLSKYEPSGNVHNPWRDYSEGYDIGPLAPQIRRNNLKRYLEQRVPNADYILIAEALGFQGGRFSGIPMTSERILLGLNRRIPATNVFLSSDYSDVRSSNPNGELGKKIRKKQGFAEPTATIVWAQIVENNISPFKVVLWNIFPFHPHQGDLLTNRPLDLDIDDMVVGIKFAKQLIEMNPNSTVVAIGEPAKSTLNIHDIPNIPVPHPSNGGAPAFRSAISSIFSSAL